MIDLSGDSAWNPRPPTLGQARTAADLRGWEFNGLAVLCHDCSGRQGAGNLEQEFTDALITGPDAFVVTADGRQAFADAVRRKLILEIATIEPGVTALHKSSAMRNSTVGNNE